MNTYLELWDPGLWERTDAQAGGGAPRSGGSR
jgi:hypothetical protein